MYYCPGDSTIKHLKIYDDLDESNFELTLHYCRRKITEVKWIIKNESEATSKITIPRI